MSKDLTHADVIAAIKKQWPNLLAGCSRSTPEATARRIWEKLGYDVFYTPTPIALKEAVENFSGELIINAEAPKPQPAVTKTATKADLPGTTGAGSW